MAVQEPPLEAQGFKNNSTQLGVAGAFSCIVFFLKIFAKDLEMFARHAKRTTITTEDVKLLARRSNSLLKYITQKSEELASSNMEQKEKKKKKSSTAKGERIPGEQEAAVTENEDSNMT
ncbi:PREDICTED: centromere protein S isoform X2 [Ficedula albicollis]|uniref:centromere protein S isoform X2 n=1 Tax=Ficedula albicollis TaxID=59894 RepID=UPI0007AD8F2D|nr:PREDICTED: centromere protein S isoform X2 [Ficedula albicollis]